MDRVILHCDLNSFYASVECLHHPEYRNIPMAVGGDVEKRHGIILAKNQLAKKAGVTTGEALWQARQKCPNLVLVKPNFTQYLRFSRMVRAIYADYSDKIESFGIDEVWIDVTESLHLFGTAQALADTIRERVKTELGVTVSVGVSFNKVFAKLGSDYKKPDATTVITRDNMKQIVWPLPIDALLYVGRATAQKLHLLGIYTIGDCACTDLNTLKRRLGKWGEYLWRYTNGMDNSAVCVQNYEPMIKSIGNSTTCPRDLLNLQDVKIVTFVLSESVAARLKEAKLVAQVISVSVRDIHLKSYTRQIKLGTPTHLSDDIAEAAMDLFEKNVDFSTPLRSIGVRASDLSVMELPTQLDLFTDQMAHQRSLDLENTLDVIRERYGFDSVQRLMMKEDPLLSSFNPKQDHVIFPESYFKG